MDLQDPCFVRLNLNIIIGVFPFLIRVLDLVYTSCLDQSRILQSISDDTIKIKNLRFIEKFAIKFFNMFIVKSLDKEKVIKPAARRNAAVDYMLIIIPKLKFNNSSKYRLYGKLSNRVLLRPIMIFLIVEVIIMMLPFAITLQTFPEIGCANPLVFTGPLVLILIMLFIIPFLLYAIHHINDASGVRKEYAANLSVIMIFYVLFLANLKFPNFIIDKRYEDTFGIIILILSHFITAIYPLAKVIRQKFRYRKLKFDYPSYQYLMQDPFLYTELKGVRHSIFDMTVRKWHLNFH